MSRSDQTPIQSEFGARSTGTEVLAEIDLCGKTAIVTGGYSGLGLETVRCLAAKSVTVIVPVRSPKRAKEALSGIGGDISILPLDLSDLSSVRSFANHIIASQTQLDLLINNAGIMACPAARVSGGWESQFGINHMGHFALTQALLPLLMKKAGNRVISLSSTGHKLSPIGWEDVNYKTRNYDKWQAYGQAKTANALFANALSRRLVATGGLAFSVHPGGIFTPLQRHLPKEEMISLGWLGDDGEPSEMAKQSFKTPEQGCSTTLWAATSDKLTGVPGVYCEDCNIASPTDTDSPTARYSGADQHACDDEEAERLWVLSESLLRDA